MGTRAAGRTRNSAKGHPPVINLTTSNGEHFAALEAMIERRGPILMRCGGAAVARSGPSPLTPEQVERIAAEVRAQQAAGAVNFADVARKVGVSRSCVAARARRCGLV